MVVVNNFLSRKLSKAEPTVAQQVGSRIAQERRLKAARDRRDIDQKAVAAAVGVSPAAVSRWENGETIPRDDVLVRLAEYFGVTASWLRYGEGNGTGAPKLPLREPQRPIIPRRKGKGQ